MEEKVVMLGRYTLTAGFGPYEEDHALDKLRIVDSCANYTHSPTVVSLERSAIKVLFDLLKAICDEDGAYRKEMQDIEKSTMLGRFALVAGYNKSKYRETLKIVDSVADYTTNTPTMVLLEGSEIKALFDFLKTICEEEGQS